MEPRKPPLPPVVRTSELRAAGVSRRRAQGPEFVRVRRGLVGYAGLSRDYPDLRIAAVVEELPPHSVVGGWAAARLFERMYAPDDLVVFDGSARWEVGRPHERSEGTARVLLCAPRESRVRHRDDVRVFRSEVPEDERTDVTGVATTNPVRTAFDLARLLPTVPAVIALDRLAHLGLVRLDDLRALVHERRLWHGRGRALRVMALADDGAESPQETLLRLGWIGAGLPRPLCNPVIVDERGRFVARVDLLDPDAGVVGEYDGAVHSGAAARSDDARRQEALEELGLVVVRATAHDVGDDGVSRAWEARLRAAYRRASHTSRAPAWRIRGRAGRAEPS